MLYIGGSFDSVHLEDTDGMEWYGSITRVDSSNGQLSKVWGLELDEAPETSDKSKHKYIDHIAINGQRLFGTTR